jgi:hypothetical protein
MVHFEGSLQRRRQMSLGGLAGVRLLNVSETNIALAQRLAP